MIIKYTATRITLRLKKFNREDFSAYYQLVGDERVMAMITERALSQEEAEADFEKLLFSNRQHANFGSFMVFDAVSDAFMGLGKLEITIDNPEEVELGYILRPEFWGKGIGTILAQQLMVKLEGHPELKYVFAIIDPKNEASRKILINQGFVSREFKDFDGLPGEILVYTPPTS